MCQSRTSVYITRISLGLILVLCRCVMASSKCRCVMASSNRLIFGGPVIAFELAGKSLFTVKRLLMKLTRRRRVCLVSETGMLSQQFRRNMQPASCYHSLPCWDHATGPITSWPTLLGTGHQPLTSWPILLGLCLLPINIMAYLIRIMPPGI